MTETARPHPRPPGDISVTALYTSHAWRWGGLDGAELMETPEARTVFRVTNFALGIARLLRWDLPRLAPSLVQRHAMIDYLLRASQATEVVELAAGLSRRGVSVTRDARVTYTELDLPHMIARKREILARTPAGQAVAARPNLRLVEGDARTAPLSRLPAGPGATFIIAEGLLMYLPADEQRALWGRIASFLKERPVASSSFVFDLVPACEQPRPGVIGRALRRLMKAFTGGKSFETDGRTRHDIKAELHDAGFAAVEMLEPRSLAQAWCLPFPRARTQALVWHCRV